MQLTNISKSFCLIIAMAIFGGGGHINAGETLGSKELVPKVIALPAFNGPFQTITVWIPKTTNPGKYKTCATGDIVEKVINLPASNGASQTAAIWTFEPRKSSEAAPVK